MKMNNFPRRSLARKSTGGSINKVRFELIRLDSDDSNHSNNSNESQIVGKVNDDQISNQSTNEVTDQLKPIDFDKKNLFHKFLFEGYKPDDLKLIDVLKTRTVENPFFKSSLNQNSSSNDNQDSNQSEIEVLQLDDFVKFDQSALPDLIFLSSHQKDSSTKIHHSEVKTPSNQDKPLYECKSLDQEQSLNLNKSIKIMDSDVSRLIEDLNQNSGKLIENSKK